MTTSAQRFDTNTWGISSNMQACNACHIEKFIGRSYFDYFLQPIGSVKLAIYL